MIDFYFRPKFFLASLAFASITYLSHFDCIRKMTACSYPHILWRGRMEVQEFTLSIQTLGINFGGVKNWAVLAGTEKEWWRWERSFRKLCLWEGGRCDVDHRWRPDFDKEEGHFFLGEKIRSVVLSPGS